MNRRTRREFLRMAGAGAAASTAVGAAFARQPAQTPASYPDRSSLPAMPERRFELGLASYTLRKFNLDQTIAMTTRVGLKNISLKDFHLPMNAGTGEIKAVAEKVRTAGLNLYGCGVVYMRNEQEVNRAFEYAKAAGMTTIIGVPNHDLLPLVDKKVKEYNILMAIHNHGPGDKLYPTSASIYEKIKDFDARIGMCMDIGHTARIGEDPVLDTIRFAERVLDVHVKDVSAAEARGTTVQIGRGVIDVPAFIRALVSIDFAGYVSLEYEKDENDPLPGLAESVGFVRGAMATIANPGFARPTQSPPKSAPAR